MCKLTIIQGGAKAKTGRKTAETEYEDALLRLWERVLIQLGEAASMADLSAHPDLLRKMAYLYVKSIGAVQKNSLKSYDRELIETFFQRIEWTMRLIGRMTPRQLMQMFPIQKTYDGERWGTKDYYSTLEEVEQKGLDSQIGSDRASEFLMEYENEDIRKLMITFMLVASRMRVLQGSKDIMEEFMEEQGVSSYSYYEKEGIMLNRQTGEVVKVEKPRIRVPKYLKVIEGGIE